MFHAEHSIQMTDGLLECSDAFSYNGEPVDMTSVLERLVSSTHSTPAKSFYRRRTLLNLVARPKPLELSLLDSLRANGNAQCLTIPWKVRF